MPPLLARENTLSQLQRLPHNCPPGPRDSLGTPACLLIIPPPLRTTGCCSWRRARQGTASVQCCVSCSCCVTTPSSPLCSVGDLVRPGGGLLGAREADPAQAPRTGQNQVIGWACCSWPLCAGFVCEMRVIVPPSGRCEDDNCRLRNGPQVTVSL